MVDGDRSKENKDKRVKLKNEMGDEKCTLK